MAGIPRHKGLKLWGKAVHSIADLGVSQRLFGLNLRKDFRNIVLKLGGLVRREQNLDLVMPGEVGVKLHQLLGRKIEGEDAADFEQVEDGCDASDPLGPDLIEKSPVDLGARVPRIA